MNYELKYSARRTIALSIKEGKLIVKAPFGTSREKIESVILSHKRWIENHLKAQEERDARIGTLTDERIKELKKLAKQIIPLKVERYSKIMGLKYGRITITSAKTRFGSCSSAGNLSFSYRLMLYPEEAIDYVVVHELAHLVELNHSERFYRIVASVMPDYKERQRILKK
ncbi:MAG: M48 family metallopeptidase [Ruminococcaceae bacterium]|nr:M48 family metallopeptidase [Oscillospiraceae bacterium]